MKASNSSLVNFSHVECEGLVCAWYQCFSILSLLACGLASDTVSNTSATSGFDMLPCNSSNSSHVYIDRSMSDSISLSASTALTLSYLVGPNTSYTTVSSSTSSDRLSTSGVTGTCLSASIEDVTDTASTELDILRYGTGVNEGL